MTPTSGRDTFQIGAAFPASDSVAVFATVIATALNDLITTNRWLLRQYTPDADEGVAVGEKLYTLRLAMAHTMEFRASVISALRQPEVVAFLDEADRRQPDLGLVKLRKEMVQIPGAQPWVKATLDHVRNQTFHYGGDKYNEWTHNQWALRAVAGFDSEISYEGPQTADMRLAFADEVAQQHLIRKIPEFEHADEVEEKIVEARVRHLFKSTAALMKVSMDFGIAVVVAYLDQLPDGIVVAERTGEAPPPDPEA